MKLKFVQEGYEDFTGLFGVVNFENGVSTEDVSPLVAFRIAASVRVVDADTGLDIGVLSEQGERWEKPVEIITYKSVAEVEAEAARQEKQDDVEVADVEKPAPQFYTREQLEQIADKEGIAGLRKIGDEYGVKGTSVAKLIYLILDATKPSQVETTDQEEKAAE
ncbi:hypothetical protein [Methyloversatilis sp.]|uniref:hypothetical protein n=1 Tax=Methyloversatilis sp. TaxID=2569862 RepID=UPI0035AF11B0